MWKTRILAVVLVAAFLGLGFLVYKTEIGHKKSFQLGLDLSGGSYVTYRADTSELSSNNIKPSLDALRDVIERRINLFGISEPSVLIENVSLGQSETEHRLVVELPGVTDVEKAVAMIGQTPLLEFKVENPKFKEGDAGKITISATDIKAGKPIEIKDLQAPYISTDLTGRYLDHALVEFDQKGQPSVSLQFDADGAKLFEKITSENVGKTVAIYLDGSVISTPVVQEAISGGQAVITGTFTPEEAKTLVGRLNSGALPIPIELIGTETIGPSLGAHAVNAGVFAGLLGFIAIAIFLILYYRLPGLLAVIALAAYASIVLALFKYIPVTLTSAGIAGFIISLGVAVDGNILIFERMKEEIRNGRAIPDAISVGFSRAWASIRDSNLSSILSAVVLYWFGSSLIKGFAFTLGIGVIISMFSAITITRVLLLAVNGKGNSRIMRFLFTPALGGFKKKRI